MEGGKAGQPPALDIAFVIDCTASMGSYIEAAKTNVKRIVHRIWAIGAGVALRTALDESLLFVDHHVFLCLSTARQAQPTSMWSANTDSARPAAGLTTYTQPFG